MTEDPHVPMGSVIMGYARARYGPVLPEMYLNAHGIFGAIKETHESRTEGLHVVLCVLDLAFQMYKLEKELSP